MTMDLNTNVNHGIAIPSKMMMTMTQAMQTKQTATMTDDLNLSQTLQKAAVKLLTKRNVLKGTHDQYGTKETASATTTTTMETSSIENHQPEFSPLSGSTIDNSINDTIAAVRANINKVLHMYFHNDTIPTETTNEENWHSHAQGHAEPLKAVTTATTTARSTPTSLVRKLAATLTSDYLENSTLYHSNRSNRTNSSSNHSYSSNSSSSSIASNAISYLNSNNVISTTITHLSEATSNSTLAAATDMSLTTTSATAATTITTAATHLNAVPGNITYPSYGIAISSYENCSALFTNYTMPEQGLFCNWTWDMFLCWPPTPAGVMAHMSCPTGFHGVDARKFANRKCELNGHWGARPNETETPAGWTDYRPCFNQEVQDIFDKVSNIELVVAIAKRTRTLEIVGLVLSLVALILSLIIFCNFRTLRNNRTKIHKNLFIAMVLQVVVRLSLYLDQAFRRDRTDANNNASLSIIENMPYLCEASYVLLEYAKTAMFMWMFIEGWYLHNMVTVTVFQGRFPYKLYSIVGWGMPVLMTTVWAISTAFHYADTMHVCWWNYNLTLYYWILEGPRIVIITINFAFLLNIIRVLVMKLRESQASDIEQTRKAVRAAIVLLPLLGTINVLYIIPALETPWKFALWSYVTHFLTTFQGFFIALIYCFLNGEVRAVLLKSLATYMSVRGHPEWVPKRASMYSAGYNTAPDTENHNDNKRNESPYSKRLNGRKGSCTTVIHQTNTKTPKIQITPRLSHSNASGQANHNQLQMPLQNTHHQHQESHHHMQHLGRTGSNNNNNGGSLTSLHSLTRQQQQAHHQHIGHPYSHHRRPRHSWMLTLCFRGQKVLRVPPASSEPPESVVFELSEQ